ncbi:MAG: NAD-dependent succinate-semialdehyde dehydrogenase [Rhodobacteraceae bacterium]|nr:NAD-dependent succinate-semialdehyde dehydrogenase [Paracoccaceae bacterium]
MSNYPNTQLYIDGTWRDASDGRTLAVIDPSTEEEIGRVACATKADLDAALAATERGFSTWRRVAAFERSKILRNAAEKLRAESAEIATIMTAEQGKPVDQSLTELMGAADMIDWYAEEARRTYGQVIPARAIGVTQFTIKEPVGPVVAFSPWNFPVSQIVKKMAAALSVGCSIIVKGPEETPASPARMIQCFLDAGIPAGVIGLVYGDPAEISSYLIPHPTIAKISFTGSTPVGKQLAGLAGQHMKRATMELGGHGPVIVAADADLDAAVSDLATFKYRNAGQICVSPTRFLIEEPVYDRFLDAFTAYAEGLKIGPGHEKGVDMGPLANERRIPAIEGMIEDAVNHGARIVTGGKRIGNKGWFFEPTILADVPIKARIMNEEPFGPVAVINRFTDLDAAIAEANRLRFGLGAFAYAGSGHTQQRLRDEVQSGMLTINHLGLALPETPFGGLGDSGYGFEGGSEAVESYLSTRFVTQLH